MQSAISKRPQSSEHRKAHHCLSGNNLLAFNQKAGRKNDVYIPVHPRGLYVMHPEDFKWCTELEKIDAWCYFTKEVQWYQRFGIQYPNTAHYNGFHLMANAEPRVEKLVRKAIDYAISHMVDHPTLRRMREQFDNVSIAVMLHKAAKRSPAPTKREPLKTKGDKDSWGLGAHPDTWAPLGTGLVLMISLADTMHYDRRFKFTMPSKGYGWEVITPHGTIVIFTADAYEAWYHESVRCPWQDGDCVSLTVRMKDIDSYDGWAIAADVAEQLKSSGVNVPEGDNKKLKEASCAFAKQMQARRIEELDAQLHEWDSRNLSHLEPNPNVDQDHCLYLSVPNSTSGRPDFNPAPYSPKASDEEEDE
jgi:hypothetical protein